ncbi:unnamed protein product [Toxocara canis]|uniref:Metallophos domain-containing protein n=1 Tax=Toxocara canis TaxID=6265 RepID=A0A183ULK9_TOXCA|nr:unnamed protein product [Toxocara canis]
MCRRRVALFFTIQLFTIIWNEWVTWTWSELLWNVQSASEDHEVRFLVVADPQLIGYWEERHLFPDLTRWDADRYLRKGFVRALRASGADVVVFLGDLMNEGVHMSKSEFELSVARFENIFHIPDHKIYVPGDNDVGGEHERVLPYLVGRFANHFVSNFNARSLGLGSLNFVHVNSFNGATDVIWNGSTSLTVVLSHLPILRFRGLVQQLRQMLFPTLILSAHDHVANFYEEHRHSSRHYTRVPLIEVGPVAATVGQDAKLVEFQTATCNYRMGVANMAYGNYFTPSQY